MLVQSMNTTEITTEVRRDYEIIQNTSIVRLAQEYDRERKKLKIDKTRIFTKEYCIRTAAKNNWLLFLRKRPSEEKYKGLPSIAICAVTYYYNETGLRVFNSSHPELLSVYNGHFFSRYNERMKLNLNQPVEAIKHFFKYNGDISYTLTDKQDGDFVVGFCPGGFTLAEFQNDRTWLVNKTFVSKDMIRPDQDEAAKALFFKEQLDLALGVNALYKNETARGYDKDRLIAINGYNPD